MEFVAHIWNPNSELLLQFLQLQILLPIRLPIQLRRDELLRLDLLAVKVLEDGLHGQLADLVGMLDRVGVNLAVSNRSFAVVLPVEADNLDLVGFAGFLEGSASAEGGGVVDGEDAGEVGRRLQGVLRAIR